MFGLVTGGVESRKVSSTCKPGPSWFLSHDRCAADCVPHKSEEASSKKHVLDSLLPYSEHPPSAPRARLSDLALRITSCARAPPARKISSDIRSCCSWSSWRSRVSGDRLHSSIPSPVSPPPPADHSFSSPCGFSTQVVRTVRTPEDRARRNLAGDGPTSARRAARGGGHGERRCETPWPLIAHACVGCWCSGAFFDATCMQARVFEYARCDDEGVEATEQGAARRRGEKGWGRGKETSAGSSNRSRARSSLSQPSSRRACSPRQPSRNTCAALTTAPHRPRPCPCRTQPCSRPAALTLSIQARRLVAARSHACIAPAARRTAAWCKYPPAPRAPPALRPKHALATRTSSRPARMPRS